MLATDAFDLGVVDEVIVEPRGGAHRDTDEAAVRIGESVRKHLAELEAMRGDELLAHRYAKFRAMGVIRGAS
jgi:acetyl-CoA carboxylase alpha subunit